ncbi:MAG: hypothetical protein J6B41_06650 [Alistipes sp.]|nr:hypothetical protein [Alistipes sp.]
MPNNYCGLSEVELAEVRERHRHFVPVRVDDRTTIFIDPSRNVEEARKRFIKDLKFWRTKHFNDD